MTSAIGGGDAAFVVRQLVVVEQPVDHHETVALEGVDLFCGDDHGASTFATNDNSAALNSPGYSQ
jgi:hypothetical protein